MHRLTTLCFPLALALGACDTEDAATTDDEVGEQRIVEVAAEDAAPNGRHGHRHRARLARLCAELDCTDEQAAAIEDLMKDQAPPRPKVKDRKAWTEANQALADAFRSDDFDAEALAAHRTAVGRRHFDGIKTGMTNALVGLHAILTPEQRAELADLSESRGLPFMAPGHHRGMHKRGPGKRGKGPVDKPDITNMAERGTDRLCEAVTCTDEQRAEILAAIQGGMQPPDPEKMRSLHATLATAFRGDVLTAEQLEAHFAAIEAKRAEHMTARDAVLVEIHQLLTTEQRDVVADKIEDRGPHALTGRRGHRGHRGPGKGHHGPM